MTCFNCYSTVDAKIIPKGWLRLEDGTEQWLFCGRICLIEWVAPNIKKAVAIKQWVPTDEEKERMTQ